MLQQQPSDLGNEMRHQETEENRASNESPIRVNRVTKDYLGGKVVALDDMTLNIKVILTNLVHQRTIIREYSKVSKITTRMM